MGIARHLEERLERLVDGVSAAVFRGKMHPVDLGNRLVRFADLRLEDTWLGPTIPNVYKLFVSEADLAAPDTSPQDLAVLGEELGHVLKATAEESGWATRGPISVTVEPGEGGTGATTVQAGTQPGLIRPWGQLIAVRGSGAHSLGDNRVGVGRGSDAEVRLDDGEVSRHHAVVIRHGGTFWLADVGSTNGTWHNRTKLESDPVQIHPGDMIRFGPATFTFRVL